jgi:prepilin-type N-terminal cleavage/methylation domain-containing protein
VPMKSSYPNPFDRFHRQRGMSLVESVIGLLVLTIVFLSGAQPLRAEATRSEVQSDL